MNDPYKSSPIVGGASAKSFNTGLEDFDIPWDNAPQGGSQGSIGSPGQAMSMAGAPEYEEAESASASGGGFDVSGMMDQLEIQKIQQDYKRMVAQARFFLPRTLEQIGSQMGSQGAYWGSARRDQQQEAAKKTRFDLTQAKADAEYALQMKFLEQAAENQSEQGGRSA